MATKSAASPAFAQLHDSVHNLQSRAEELLDRIRKEAGALVGKDIRRKMDHLLNQARAFPGDVQKRGAKTMKALEARASGAVSEIRTQVAKRFEPLVGRLSLPSKHEVELLAKRLSSLEKKVDDLLSARHGRG
jgi:polyhydroxyalkanoate synthesis regulator phasin